MAASRNVNAAKAFVARFGTMVETMVASRYISALLNFVAHHIGSTVKGSRQLCCRGVELNPCRRHTIGSQLTANCYQLR